MGIQQFDQLCKIGERPCQTVDFVDVFCSLGIRPPMLAEHRTLLKALSNPARRCCTGSCEEALDFDERFLPGLFRQKMAAVDRASGDVMRNLTPIGETVEHLTDHGARPPQGKNGG